MTCCSRRVGYDLWLEKLVKALDVIPSCDFSFGLLMFGYAAGRCPLYKAAFET